ncbi:hypothetical protein QBC47DRAFT_187462 [Echria macrotheca]|uniref:Uncharacterized protein n=1 Tax=Echria macrotheca TaxID=438768 RepID=A0AAJ0FCI9_9PEZI|nr:hypothetical protein QBC47DRAFT_187462 [Echria macrotheca]
MRCRLALGAILFALEGVVAAKCSTDACFRAVTSIGKGRNGPADCSSFFRVTVTPATRTITTSVTITTTTKPSSTTTRSSSSSTRHSSTSTRTTSTIPAKKGPPKPPRHHVPREVEYEAFDGPEYHALEERQVTASPTSIPPYASKCSAKGAYSSACSCLRVSHATTTAPGKTTTKTVTVTKTTGVITSTSRTLNGTSSSTNTTASRSSTSTSSSLHSTSSTESSGSHSSSSTSRTTGSIFTNSTQTTAKSTSSAPFTNSTTTIYVISSTTVLTTSGPPWGNSSTITTTSANGTTGFHWNSTVSATLNTTRPSYWNSTTRFPSKTLTNTTHPIWSNSSMPTLTLNTTSFHWPNTTHFPTTSFNSTSVRWPNMTHTANTTTPRWHNTTSTPTSSPTPTIDTTCGKTVSPFAVQIAQPGGTFDGWFLNLVGNSVLFTNSRSSASQFSVEATGHLCVVGYSDEDDHPSIGAVGIHDPSSDVWLLRRQTLDSLNGDYAAVTCSKGSGMLSCAANTTNPATHWLACGIQLDLSTDGGSTVPINGRNCTSVELKIT